MVLFTIDSAVYSALSAAAKDKVPCPTHISLGDSLGISEKSVRTSVRRLEKGGRIRISPQKGFAHKVVTLTETGERTAQASFRSVAKAVPKKEAPSIRPVTPAESFLEALRRSGERFEDHPVAIKRKTRTIITGRTTGEQFSYCGISEVYQR